MRSFRAKPSGWRYESSRHSLAARGIASRKYAAENDGYAKTAGFLKEIVSDGKPQTENFQKLRKQQDVMRMNGEVMEKLRAAEDAGNISPENGDRFLQGEFTTQTKDYLDGTIDRTEYEANVRRKLKYHMQTHSKTLKLFDASEHPMQDDMKRMHAHNPFLGGAQ